MIKNKSYKILIEKVYGKGKHKNLSRTSEPTIGLLMMVKNEKKRIQVSMDSVTGYVDYFIIYDTGSTDNTIELIKKHCSKNKINLYMIQGEFTNFSESRNVSLEYADTVGVDYLILLDVNDELRGGEYLRKFAKSQKATESTGYLTRQDWWSGQYDKYYNMRFVKANSGWRYRGSVHEWMKNTSVKEGEKDPPVIRMPEEIILYQDRTKDDNKTGKRFHRDKILLLKDYKKNPIEPRTLFYLAQTCSCLQQNEDSFYYYKLRSHLDGFQEEKFHSYLRCGDLTQSLKHDWHDSMAWYMKALEHSDRVEPLLKIADYYKNIKKWSISFNFLYMACSLQYPHHCILFVDKHSYDYTRWHYMGIVAFYCKQYEIGRQACLKAIKIGLNSELDSSNLKFYENKIEEKTQVINKNINKKDFMIKCILELKQKFPRMTPKQLKSLSNSKWKKHRIKNNFSNLK